MTTETKLGIVAALLLGAGLYLKFVHKGKAVVEAAKGGGGGGGGSSSGSSSVGRMPSVMVADVNPVIAVSSYARPRPTAEVAPSATTTSTTSIARPISTTPTALKPTADVAPKPAPIGTKLPVGVKIGADGYTWG